MVDGLARGTRMERAFFALAIAVFAWALFQRFGLRDTSTAANSFVVLTAVMALSGAAPLFRRRGVRYGLMALSAMALLGFFLARY